MLNKKAQYNFKAAVKLLLQNLELFFFSFFSIKVEKEEKGFEAFVGAA